MAKCANCGAELQPNAKFCVECGEKVASKKICPQCGTELPSEAKFCLNCGAKVPTDSVATRDASFSSTKKTSSSGGRHLGDWSRIYEAKIGAVAASTSTSAAPRASAPNDDMVLIQGGTFKMGSDRNYEKTAHYVMLSSYYISKYQVTQDDWEKIMGENPNYFNNNPANGEVQGLRPVENVSWFDAIVYCNTRSEAEGLTPCYAIDGKNVTCDWNADGYRLPTEAEWEYAARGGGKASRQTKYAGSDNIDEVAWYSYNSKNKTHQVGLKAPNAAGLYDMSGNVWEWCWDWWGDYTSEAASDPRGASSGTYRVRRGGSWGDGADNCRVSNCDHGSPVSRHSRSGFRVCSRA